MKNLCVALMALLSLGLLACENVDSEDVMTSGVYANITGTADGEGATLVKATLRVGGATGNTFLDLMGDDRLVATQGEDEKDMIQRNLLGSIWYESTFEVDAADTPFAVGFLRTVDEGAPESSFALPAPFAFTAPAADTSFSRASEDITLTWDASGTSDKMSLSANGDCIRIYSKSIDGDPGTVVIPHDEFEPQNDEEATTCSVTITLERRRAGDLDGNYGEGGEVHGVQTRSMKVLSAP